MRGLLTRISRRGIMIALSLIVAAGLLVSLFLNFGIRADTIGTTDDNGCLPVVSIEPIKNDMSETNPDQNIGKFKVKYRNIQTSGTFLQVNLTLAGTATPRNDYVVTEGGGFNGDKLSVTFNRNEAKEKIVIFKAVDDDKVESDPDPEDIVVSIDRSNSFTIDGTRRVDLSISDNDQPTPSVSVIATDDDAAEAGSDPGLFTFKSSKKLSTELTINYTISSPATLDNSATNGTDYDTIESSLTIPANATLQTVQIEPIDDTIKDEGDEPVVITITENSAYKINPTYKTATVTIADNDSENLSTVSVTTIDGSAVEAITSDTGKYVLTRTGGNMSQPLTVSFTMNGSATLSEDYTLDPGGLSVSFPGVQTGQATTTIKVTAVRDSLREELTEDAVLTITPSNKYKIGIPGFAAVSVINNPQVAYQKQPMLASFAAYLAPSIAHAETKECGTIEGIVYGKSSNGAKTALKGATVTLKNASGNKIKDPVKTTTTGKFIFENVPVEVNSDSHFKVEAAAVGFKNKEVPATLSPDKYRKDNVEIVLDGIDGLKLKLLGQSFTLDDKNKPAPKPKVGVGQAEIEFSCSANQKIRKTTDGNGTVALTNDELVADNCTYPIRATLIDDPKDEKKPSFAYLFDPRHIDIPNAGEYTMEGAQPLVWGQVYENVGNKRTPPVAVRSTCVAIDNSAKAINEQPEECTGVTYRSGKANEQGYYSTSIPWGLIAKYTNKPAVGVVACVDASHEIVSIDPINARDPNANRRDIMETRY